MHTKQLFRLFQKVVFHGEECNTVRQFLLNALISPFCVEVHCPHSICKVWRVFTSQSLDFTLRDDAEGIPGMTLMHYLCYPLEINTPVLMKRAHDRYQIPISGICHSNRQTPLHVACRFKNRQAAKYLLSELNQTEAGRRVISQPDIDGFTALHWACTMVRLDIPIIDLFTSPETAFSQNINAQNHRGETALGLLKMSFRDLSCTQRLIATGLCDSRSIQNKAIYLCDTISLYKDNYPHQDICELMDKAISLVCEICSTYPEHVNADPAVKTAILNTKNPPLSPFPISVSKSHPAA